MKNIFKKNHIIIIALLIMIVIAGYLSFTNKDTPEDSEVASTADPDTDDFGVVAQTDGMEVVTDTTGTETDTTGTTTDTTDTDTTTTDDTTDTTTTDTTDTTEDTTDTTTEITDTTTDDTNAADDTTPVTENAADELGNNDISDEDILASAHDVTDNGELDLEDGVPGEAVLASAGIDSSFFISSKIDREQMRSRNSEKLMEIIGSADISEEKKQEAINSMIALTQISERENAAELLLGANGFSDAVVLIVGNKANVVVNSETLSEQQLAIIEDVVKDETEIAVKNIKIKNVVVTE